MKNGSAKKQLKIIHSLHGQVIYYFYIFGVLVYLNVIVLNQILVMIKVHKMHNYYNIY